MTEVTEVTMICHRPNRTARRTVTNARGFTLIEMLVSMLLMSFIVLALYNIFDFNSKVARAQTNITEMQQSLRAAQYDAMRLIRMAGRGPIPLRTTGRVVPNAVALQIVNNVPSNTRIGFTANTGPTVVQGTDLVVVRGVFNTSLFQINYADPSSFSISPTAGSVTINDKSPTGVPHELGPLVDAICDTNSQPESLLIVSPLDDAIYAVVELDAAGSRSSVDCSGTAGANNSITVRFFVQGGTYTAQYAALSAGGAFPAALTSAAFVGLLEEHRFYVREIYAVDGDPGSDLMPRFSRARVFPGTDVPYANDPGEWRNDIADGIFDLQAALGIDGNDDGVITDQNDGNDEWLFNHPNDNVAAAQWNTVQPAGTRESRLYNIRLTTMVRTGRRDTSYQAPLLTLIEDHDYTQAPSDRFNQRWERAFRRRALTTIIDLRNLS